MTITVDLPDPVYAGKTSDQIIEELLTQLGRERPLLLHESQLLERVILRSGIQRTHRWYWLPEDDRRLKLMVRKGMTATSIAVSMNRTPEAVRTRIKKLRKPPQKAQVRVRARGGRG